LSTNAYLVLGEIKQSGNADKRAIAKALRLTVGRVEEAFEEILLDVVRVKS
jgi:hypothetical protein